MDREHEQRDDHEEFELTPTHRPAAEPEPPRVVSDSTGIAWGLVVVLLLLALVVVFTVQNTESVPIRFLWMEGTFSLALVVWVTVGVTAIITEMAELIYRRRRRQRIAEREELRRLRGET